MAAPEEQKTRKERSDKGKPRGPRKAKPKISAAQRRKLTRAEARQLTSLLESGVRRFYGYPAEKPEADYVDDLALTLEYLFSVPPLSLLAGATGAALQAAGGAASTPPASGPPRAGSAAIALGRYLYGWHTRNENMYALIYATEVANGRLKQRSWLPTPQEVIEREMRRRGTAAAAWPAGPAGAGYAPAPIGAGDGGLPPGWPEPDAGWAGAG